jgi:hypothetical protein
MGKCLICGAEQVTFPSLQTRGCHGHVQGMPRCWMNETADGRQLDCGKLTCVHNCTRVHRAVDAAKFDVNL